MSTVLVTGAAGFIGRRVVAALAADSRQVVGTDLVQPPGSVPFVVADLADPSAMATIIDAHGVESVVHCGGISGSMLARDQPALLLQVNVAATMALLELARARSASFRLLRFSPGLW